MEGQGVNTAIAALGAYRFKCAIVVDEDIDIYDDGKVLWAVMTRTQADRSFFTVPGSYISRVDTTGYPPWQMGDRGPRILATRLGIDATRPCAAGIRDINSLSNEVQEESNGNVDSHDARDDCDVALCYGWLARCPK